MKEKIIAFIEALYKECEEKDKIAGEYLDHLLRLKAEFENYKKNMERQRLNFVKYAQEELIARLLPILDSFEIALNVGKNKAELKQIILGVEMVLKNLWDILSRSGLKAIETKGKMFDPELHEAIEYVQSDKYPAHTILEEIQKGYILADRVIRPAKVKISKSLPDHGNKA